MPSTMYSKLAITKYRCRNDALNPTPVPLYGSRPPLYSHHAMTEKSARMSVRSCPNSRRAHDSRNTPRHRRTLLLDADDTLWENNIYFLEVTERFLDIVEHHRIDREEARRILSDTERKNIPFHGYGSRSFALSVVEAYETLVPSAQATVSEELRGLARAIFERASMELLPGVEEALAHLSAACRLILVTKGDHDEQLRKVQCSGLEGYFESIEVVGEKTAETYRELVERLQLQPVETWMIGNSPRSDINPALAAGLNAVLIPHPSTWELEIEDIQDAGERLIVVDSMGDVVALFSPPNNDPPA